MHSLKLYVTGRTPGSEILIRELQDALEEEYKGQYTLEVLNVFDCVEEAVKDKVLATPTLLRVFPPPVLRIVGGLTDRERVLVALEIEAVAEDP